MGERPHGAPLSVLQPQVTEIMSSNIDRYNPSNIGVMEAFVEALARENAYDLEACLLLLKLYQFYPDNTFNNQRVNYVAKVLLKTLMRLPSNDFQICRALVDPNLFRVIKLQDVEKLESLLDRCQFDQFWGELERCRDSVAGVEGFDAAVRDYVCSVIVLTNQSISVPQLQSYLGKLPFEKFKKLVEERGWKLNQNSNTVSVKDQAAVVKARKITESIDFADVATILSAAAKGTR